MVSYRDNGCMMMMMYILRYLSFRYAFGRVSYHHYALPQPAGVVCGIEATHTYLYINNKFKTLLLWINRYICMDKLYKVHFNG